MQSILDLAFAESGGEDSLLLFLHLITLVLSGTKDDVQRSLQTD